MVSSPFNRVKKFLNARCEFKGGKEHGDDMSYKKGEFFLDARKVTGHFKKDRR